MTISLNFELVQTLDDDFFIGLAPGINVLEKTIIASRLGDLAGAWSREFWESADQGNTFQKISTLPDSGLLFPRKNINLPEDRVICATWSEDANGFSIYLSTNGAHTWTEKQFYPEEDGNIFGAQPTSILSYNRTSAAIGGTVNRTPQHAYNSQIAWSQDAGETWTDQPAIVLTDMDNPITALANGAKGKFLAGDNENWLYRSTDYGATWSACGAPELPTPTQQIKVWCATWLSDTVALAGGQITSSGDPYFPPLYRSTDAGETWEHIAAANIEDWPASAPALGVWEVHRLTKEGAILGVRRTQGRNLNPWWYSIDAGQTWQKPTSDGFSWNGQDAQATGSIAVDQRGKIWSFVDGGIPPDPKGYIFRGTLTC